MNDTLIKIVASQMGIPGFVLDELKASKPTLIAARFADGEVTLTVQVTSPTSVFLVTVTLPHEQLKRFPAIYDKAVTLAS